MHNSYSKYNTYKMVWLSSNLQYKLLFLSATKVLHHQTVGCSRHGDTQVKQQQQQQQQQQQLNYVLVEDDKYPVT